MKVAVLAGGQGTRLAEETRVKSKAMVRIGDRPILWHLLKYYEHYGHTRFVVALGHHAEFDPRLLREPAGRARRAVARRAVHDRVIRRRSRAGRSSWSTPGWRPCRAAGSSAWRPISATSRSC